MARITMIRPPMPPTASRPPPPPPPEPLVTCELSRLAESLYCTASSLPVAVLGVYWPVPFAAVPVPWDRPCGRVLLPGVRLVRRFGSPTRLSHHGQMQIVGVVVAGGSSVFVRPLAH